MGDRICNTPPLISWNSYSDKALLETLQEVTSVLHNRACTQGNLQPAAGSGGTPAGSVSGTTPVVNEQGLQKPWSCGFTCRWCASPCARKEGHSFHSCYEHRHRR